MKFFRASFRLLYFAFYTILRISQIIIGSFFVKDKTAYALKIRKLWAQNLLPALGIRIKTEGAPPDFPCLVLGNHRSYLDPIVIIQKVVGWPVSKAEVENWPIVGYGAKLTGVLFLKRESMTSRKITLQAIADKVREGFPVILFPEGTTTDGPSTADFKRGSFQLAAQNAIPIIPVAIFYGNKRDYWVGDATFLPHFFERFGEKNMDVRLVYGPKISGGDAQVLMETTKKWIDETLLSKV